MTYLTSCHHVPRNADINRKARFKWTSARCVAIFVEIIVSFKIKYARKTSFGGFVNEQYLQMFEVISIKGDVKRRRHHSPVLFGTVLSFACESISARTYVLLYFVPQISSVLNPTALDSVLLLIEISRKAERFANRCRKTADMMQKPATKWVFKFSFDHNQ